MPILDRKGQPVSVSFTKADADGALIWEKGKQIPFTQTDGQEGFVVKSVTFDNAFNNGGDDLEVNFLLNSDIKSKERKWG